jgi:hypothetical protein
VDPWEAFEQALATALPGPLGRAIALELRLLSSLAIWLSGRGRRLDGFAYHRRSALGGLVALLVITTPIELALWELVIPWAWLRWALFILGVYGLVWVLSFYASLRVLPHRLEPEALRVRYGALAEGRIPYDAIGVATLERRPAPGRGEGLSLSPKKTVAHLAVGGRTDVALRLNRPLALRGPLRPTPPVNVVRIAADEPERLLVELVARLPVLGAEIVPAAGFSLKSSPASTPASADVGRLASPNPPNLPAP